MTENSTEIPGYIYAESANPDCLGQGDIIQCNGDVLKLFNEFYPSLNSKDTFGKSDNYLMIVTQSCDLFKSSTRKPKLEHFSVCLVRQFDRFLLRHTKSRNFDKYGSYYLTSEADHDSFKTYISGIINNSNLKQNLFLPKSVYFKSHMIALLPLKYSFRIDQYDSFLKERICSLRSEFQAKLGYLLADFYGRVATPDLQESGWTDKQLYTVTANLLKDLNVVSVPFDKPLSRLPPIADDSELNIEDFNKNVREIELKLLDDKRRKELAPFVKEFKKNISDNIYNILRSENKLELLNDIDLRKLSQSIINKTETPAL